MPSYYPKDYASGIIEQKNLLPKLKEYFKKDIVEIDNKLSPFDYECSKYYYELKTRTNTLNKYPTTMITLNKLQNRPLILLFKFTDKLTYIEYNKTLFDTFEVKQFSRAQKQWDEKAHIYIPIEHLKVID